MPRFPFGIPNSWYLMAYSEELAPGAVLPLHFLDRDLVAFRSDAGEAAVLDAHCPHLGAHLGVGGTVVGDTLRCPFHGWRWRTDGSCAEFPYAKRIPAKARIATYPAVERNGMIFAWHHARGEPPSFEIPDIPEWHDPNFLRPWLHSEWTLKTHPQEMAENGIDWPHFERVHMMAMPEDRDHAFHSGFYTWRVGTSKSVSTLDGASDDLVIEGENWGLGYNWLRQHGRFDTIVATGLTPIDAETTRVRMGVIARRGDRDEDTLRRELRAYMDEHAVVATQDFPIWENKLFRPTPLLCDGDGPIGEFRAWAAQFY